MPAPISSELSSSDDAALKTWANEGDSSVVFLAGTASALMDAMDVDMDHTELAASPRGAREGKRKAPLPLHRCRFLDWSPSAIAALAISPPSFDTAALGFGGASAERGLLAVARANGDAELMCWGGEQGWVAWRTLPSPFAPPPSSSSRRKPTSLLSHILFTHQTTLSPSDIDLYADDIPAATKEVDRLQKEGVRLFGVGGVASELIEWEWGGPGSEKNVGRVKSNLTTLPPIFALAANRSSSHLAVACEDSTIRILSILDDALEVISRIEVGGPGKVRALSLAWGAPAFTAQEEKDSEDSEVDDPLPKHYRTPQSSTLLAGCSNSTLTLYTASNSHLTHFAASHRMTVDKHPGEPTVVWAVAVLSKDSLVSADSMGNVKFWDAQTGTQRQSFRASKADLLSLAIGPTGKTMFVSGVDQKTTEFHLASISSSPRWILSSSRRLHAHDVRSLVISPPFQLPLPAPSPNVAPTKPQVPVLTSGGLDLSLILVPCSPGPSALPNPVSATRSTEFETTTHRKAAYVPHRSHPASVATTGHLLVRRPRSVGVWFLKGTGGIDGGWEKELEMDLKLQTNLVASAISKDGKWVAVSDLYETKLFKLSTKGGVLTPRRQKTFSTSLSSSLPPSLGTGASSLLFTPNSSRLVVAAAFTGVVAVVDLARPEGVDDFEVRVLEHRAGSAKPNGREVKGLKKPHGLPNGNGAAHASDESDEDEESDDEMEEVDGGKGIGKMSGSSVTCLAVSSDGKWLSCADLSRKVNVFDLSQMALYTTLPTPPTVPSTLSFLPLTSASTSTGPTLLLTLPSNQILLFSLATRRYLSLPSTSLETLREPCLGVSFEPASAVAVSDGQAKMHASRRAIATSQSPVAVLWGANWVSKIDFETVVPSLPATTTMNGKRARGEDAAPLLGEGKGKPLEVKVMRKYQPLLLFDFVRQGEMVAVERVWADLAKEAPEAFVRNGEFGT